MTQHPHQGKPKKTVSTPASFHVVSRILFLILVVSVCASQSSILEGFKSVSTLLSSTPNPEQPEVILGLFIAFENGWIFHLGVIISFTFLLGLSFRRYTFTYFRWSAFILTFLLSLGGAFAFFYLEVLAEILSDSDKASHTAQIAIAKLCSLIVAVFSFGLSFEMWKKLFFEPEENHEE